MSVFDFFTLIPFTSINMVEHEMQLDIASQVRGYIIYGNSILISIVNIFVHQVRIFEVFLGILTK